MSKIKILFFHFCLGHGGAEKVLVNLMNNLNSDKYDITLFTLFHYGVNGKYLASHIKWKYWLNMKPFRGVTIFLKLFSSSFLHKYFIKDSFDVEIAFMQGLPTRIVSACKNPKTKKYAWLHNEVKNRNQLLNVFWCTDEGINAYNKFDGIAGVSNIVCDSFCRQLKWDGLRPATVHNVLEVNLILKKASQRIPIELSNGVINLCSVGRLVPQKAYTRLMSVFAKLIDAQVFNFHFYLLGDGILKNEIEKQIERLHLKQYVTLLGYDENPYKYVSKMDFFICSSLQEGYSTAVSESIIVGTPVLTTDCSGMKEIFGKTDAGIIVPNNEDGLLNGLTSILTNKELREKCKKGAIGRSKYFSKENLIAEFESFIGV